MIKPVSNSLYWALHDEHYINLKKQKPIWDFYRWLEKEYGARVFLSASYLDRIEFLDKHNELMFRLKYAEYL